VRSCAGAGALLAKLFTFIATGRWLSMALYTLPKPPSPISEMLWKPPVDEATSQGPTSLTISMLVIADAGALLP